MLEVRPAVDDDCIEILELRHAAEDWLAERKIDQWRPREVPLEAVRKQVSDGEFFVARLGAHRPIVAATRLVWSDPVIWRHDNAFAGYVHGLVIDRSQAGNGIGAAMLTWAAKQAALAGSSALRLDCAETNVPLRRYYERCGFSEVGRRDFPACQGDDQWFSVTLFEKSLR